MNGISKFDLKLDVAARLIGATTVVSGSAVCISKICLMAKDKICSSLFGFTSNRLEQASNQNRLAKKVGIAAAIYMSLFSIPFYAWMHVKNDRVRAVLQECCMTCPTAFLKVIATGILTKYLSKAFMVIKDKMYPSPSLPEEDESLEEMDEQTKLNKKKIRQLKILEAAKQKNAEQDRIAHKMGAAASILYAAILIPMIAKNGYYA